MLAFYFLYSVLD